MKSKRLVLVGTIVLVATIGAWALGMFSDDSQLVAVQALRAELQNDQLTSEQRSELRSQMRQQMESLSPEQREQLWDARREESERREDERLDAFFALTPQQRAAALDKSIKESEQRRKEREARRAQQGNNQQANSAQGRGQGQGGPRVSRASMTEEQRMMRSKQRLDRTSPERRAKRAEYRRLMNERRRQLGLPENNRRWT